MLYKSKIAEIVQETCRKSIRFNNIGGNHENT